ncbi:MAG: citrate synthase family protein, partial [Acidobacteriota bacterium]
MTDPAAGDPAETLDAAGAARLLGVRRETLYAYVSRGLLRSIESGDGRSRRYRRSEVERLLQQRELRRQPAKALEGALHWGAPVLESSLTLIEGGRLFYRGLDARALCGARTLEEIAGWLWLGSFDVAAGLFAEPPPPSPPPVLALGGGPFRRPWALEALQAALPVFGAADPAAWVTDRPREVARASARLLQRMARLAASDAWEGDVASSLLAGWRPAGDGDAGAARRLLDAALILCADHELNVSAFTAHCAASAGSPVASVVSAGLAALQGPEHGGHSRRLGALLREAGRPEDLYDAVTDRLRRGDPVPGYGQPLYPDGDPRYLELIDRLRRFGGARGDVVAWADALEEAGRTLLGKHPTLDAGLVLTTRALGLPRDTALCVFALGRTVGWIGHALEQYAAGRLIRPRARYVGEAPG